MNEYKRGTDPDGAPTGQALIAMLAAQHLNENKSPIFGCYIVRKQWSFLALEQKNYAISKSFACDDEEIFDVHRILHGLRFQIEKILKK